RRFRPLEVPGRGRREAAAQPARSLREVRRRAPGRPSLSAGDGADFPRGRAPARADAAPPGRVVLQRRGVLEGRRRRDLAVHAGHGSHLCHGREWPGRRAARPHRVSRAAARFLRHNFEQLEEEWPLAITAYNHGPAGVRRAISETGTTDIGVIVDRYHGPAFGFASRNFYAEFLAALDVDAHRQAYFGELAVEKPEPTRVISLDRPVGIEIAARLASTDRDTVASLNPALMDPVVTGRRLIPSGYDLRVPADRSAAFEERLTQLAAEQRVMRVSAPS